jgi:hypothetical protein
MRTDIWRKLVAPRVSTASPAEVDGPLLTPRRGLSPQYATDPDDQSKEWACRQ